MSFGVQNDYFGLQSADWELQSSSKTPESSQAQQDNEYGDTDNEQRYEKTATVECVYALKSTADGVGVPTAFKGGNTNTYDSQQHVVTGGTLETSNTERPQLTVSGEEFYGDDTALQVYDFAAEVSGLNGKKTAQPQGFSVSGDTKVNGTSVSFSVETSRLLDSVGEITVVDTYKGRVEESGDLVTAGSSIEASADTGWEKMQDASKSEENTSFDSGSINVYKNLLMES